MRIIRNDKEFNKWLESIEKKDKRYDKVLNITTIASTIEKEIGSIHMSVEQKFCRVTTPGEEKGKIKSHTGKFYQEITYSIKNSRKDPKFKIYYIEDGENFSIEEKRSFDGKNFRFLYNIKPDNRSMIIYDGMYNKILSIIDDNGNIEYKYYLTTETETKEITKEEFLKQNPELEEILTTNNPKLNEFQNEITSINNEASEYFGETFLDMKKKQEQEQKEEK